MAKSSNSSLNQNRAEFEFLVRLDFAVKCFDFVERDSEVRPRAIELDRVSVVKSGFTAWISAVSVNPIDSTQVWQQALARSSVYFIANRSEETNSGWLKRRIVGDAINEAGGALLVSVEPNLVGGFLNAVHHELIAGAIENLTVELPVSQVALS